jgi:hypothetical protein
MELHFLVVYICPVRQKKYFFVIRFVHRFPGDRSSAVQRTSISCLQKFVLMPNKNFSFIQWVHRFPGGRSSSVQSISISCLHEFVLNENKNFGPVLSQET